MAMLCLFLATCSSAASAASSAPLCAPSLLQVQPAHGKTSRKNALVIALEEDSALQNASRNLSTVAATSLEFAVQTTLLHGDGAIATSLGLVLGVMLLVFELLHLCILGVDLKAPFPVLERTEKQQEMAAEGPFQGAARLWRLYTFQHATFAFVSLFMIAALIVLDQYTNLKLVTWSDKFWDKAEEWTRGEKGSGTAHIHDFYALLLQFLLLAFMLLFSGAYQSYVTSMFIISVREGVTQRYAAQWLSGFSYYRSEIYKQEKPESDTDNPEQRIQEDVQNFLSSSVSLSIGLVSNAAQFCIFARQVYMFAPANAFGVQGWEFKGWLFWVCITYAIFSTGFIMLSGRKLESTQGALQQTEADLRFELSVVRMQAEGIALSRSEAAHMIRISQKFAVLKRSVWESMQVNKKYMIVSSFFNQAEAIVGLLFMGPSFLAGDVSLGGLMAISRTVSLLDSSLLWFAMCYNDVSSWRASTGRLVRFEDAICKHAKDTSGGANLQSNSKDGGLAMKRVTVWAPIARKNLACCDDSESDDEDDEKDTDDYDREHNHRGKDLLFQDLSLTLEPGARVLVEGPSGTGKSTLLRTLSGIWPFASGHVDIPGAAEHALVFPAEVYVPPGDLRTAACYPSVPGTNFSDSQIEAALRLVGLGTLLKDQSVADQGLSIVRDWQLALSSGQKARLALARLVLQRPAVAALDEPVAHLQSSARAPVLRKVLESLDSKSIVIIVSHDTSPELTSLFNKRLAVDAERKTLVPVPEPGIAVLGDDRLSKSWIDCMAGLTSMQRGRFF
eukprot:TRINITY_DN104966_c0_g1_i1.p1 TRINITY_DN104966_c0_g1~~TRINITY_DN104966_c0_g1_i1.p1  ORF type:complete len:787 (-),score=135.85 TRINITY_DN104966_c0_g1_i1:666-3026(-)